MARSSRPRHPRQAEPFTLRLTQGGDAVLVWRGEPVWSSLEDEDFEAEFGDDFLEYDDVADVLDYLEEIGELTAADADACQIEEEFLSPAEYAGLLLKARRSS